MEFSIPFFISYCTYYSIGFLKSFLFTIIFNFSDSSNILSDISLSSIFPFGLYFLYSCFYYLIGIYCLYNILPSTFSSKTYSLSTISLFIVSIKLKSSYSFLYSKLDSKLSCPSSFKYIKFYPFYSKKKSDLKGIVNY